MKKWLLILVALVIAGVVVYNAAIPSRLPLSEHKTFALNSKRFSRMIENEHFWPQWWPGKTGSNALSFEYNGKTYTIAEKRLTSMIIDIKGNDKTLRTEFIFIPASPDSVMLTWNSVPMAKGEYEKVRADVGNIMEKMRQFYESDDQVYGTHIVKDFVKDSALISTFSHSNEVPTTAQVYSLIDKLKTYAQKKNTAVSGYPMLNVLTKDSISYKIQVALPTAKALPNEGDIAYRWMLGGGNIIYTEVKGGPRRIRAAFKSLEEYIGDYRRTAPAIPFESLITDRRQEPDTTKWVTRVYWPVM